MELVNPFLTKNPPGGFSPTVEAHGGSNHPPGPKADRQRCILCGKLLWPTDHSDMCLICAAKFETE